MRSLLRNFSLGLICLLLIASSDVAVNVYGYGSGRSLVTAQSSSVVTVNPGANQTPDPEEGGSAVTSPSNLGHGSTNAFSLGAGVETKTCRWSGFQSVAGQITSVKLKFDWTEDGSIIGSANNLFRVQYSLNGGYSWTDVFSHVDVVLPNFGSSEVILSNAQNLTQVQVRDTLYADATGGGDTNVLASISNIRLEVETVNCIATVPGDRWKGEYYNNQTLSGSPAMVRDDSTAGTDFLSLNFGSGSPHSLCAPAVDNFSARWTRTVNFAAGTYRFTAAVDNGVRLYIDGQLKIDQWGNLPPNTYTADVALSAGNHEVKLEFVEYTGDASASLSWADLNCLANVPANRWRGEYFNNINLSGNPWMVRDDGTDFLNFNFGNGGPGGNCGLGVDNFSARWTRTVNFAASVYRFSVTVDDGVRLYVDGQLKIDKWFSQGATTYTADVALSAGAHEVKMEYFEGGGPGIALLSWVDATGVNCLPNTPLPLISSVPRTGGRENIASTAPSQAPKRCGQKNSD